MHACMHLCLYRLQVGCRRAEREVMKFVALKQVSLNPSCRKSIIHPSIINIPNDQHDNWDLSLYRGAFECTVHVLENINLGDCPRICCSVEVLYANRVSPPSAVGAHTNIQYCCMVSHVYMLSPQDEPEAPAMVLSAISRQLAHYMNSRGLAPISASTTPVPSAPVAMAPVAMAPVPVPTAPFPPPTISTGTLPVPTAPPH